MTTQITPSITQEEINKILIKYLPLDEYDKSLINYISNTILTDMPENETDLKLLIEDYLSDGNKYLDKSIKEILKEINISLHKNGIKGERKAIIAEKLEDPTRLCDIKVGSNNTITSLNFDPQNLTFDVEKLYSKVIQGNNNKNEFIIDPSKTKEMEEYLNEMRRQKELSEDYSIHHIKDESHKVDINIPSFTIHIGGKSLLNEAELKINFGRRYVLIGRNGIGKTTLLNHIVRKEIEGIPKQIQIVHVEQEAIMSDNLLMDEILLCDRERTKLIKESNIINDMINKEKNEDKLKNLSKQLIDINNKLEEIDAFSAENKAKFILLGLGFHESDFKKKIKNFSGGWRMRISLAKALFVMPDLLLLDEPTNHLDMNAVMWLEDYLLNWPYTLVIVSHAKDFIDSIATDIIHLQNQKLKYYKGNYTDFDRERTKQLKLNKRLHDAQTKKIEHMQEFINKFRYKAKRANLVQSRIKQMNKMELVDEILEDPMCIFVFPEPEKISPPILRLDNADLGYNDTVIIEKVNLSVDMTSRIALVGANGCGKTTLLKGLDGDIIPMSGLCFRHSKLRLSVFAQHHVDQLDLELSPLEQLQKFYPDCDVGVIRSHLNSFGISGNVTLRPNYLLSGGQKSRVALALIVMNNPQVILMDEPTNHLDLDAINALAIALNSFDGGLLIVSHDQNFVERVCNQIYMIENKKCKQFRGNFNDYRKYLRAQSEKNGGKINF